MIPAAVTISAEYDESRPRRLRRYRLTCARCGDQWDAQPSRHGDYTDGGLDRQARTHLRACTAHHEPTPRP